MDEGCDDSGTASTQADVTSDDAITSFAKEYSLVPSNKQKSCSAQNFDQLVESYFEGIWASAHLFVIWDPNLLEMQMTVFMYTVYSNIG